MTSSEQPTSPLSAITIALERAERLGWRTISLDRLRALANGNYNRLPPNPATAPRSAFGQSLWGRDCYLREHRSESSCDSP